MLRRGEGSRAAGGKNGGLTPRASVRLRLCLQLNQLGSSLADPAGQEAGAMLKSILPEKGRGVGWGGGVLMDTARLQMRENVVANYRTGES